MRRSFTIPSLIIAAFVAVSAAIYSPWTPTPVAAANLLGQTTGSLTATGSVTHTKNQTDTLTLVGISGTYGTVTWVIEGSIDSTNWVQLANTPSTTGLFTAAGTLSPNDNDTTTYAVNSAGYSSIRARVSAIASGTATFTLTSTAPLAPIMQPAVVPTSGGLTSTSATAGIGYATGAGGAVSQATDRTTGVTLNKVTGAITTQATSLAAGAEVTFTVTNSTVAVGDTVIASVRSGPTSGVNTFVTVTTVAAGSFNLTLNNPHASTADTGAAIINFAVIKAVGA